MGGFGSQAFLGCLHAEGLIKPAVMVFLPDEIVDNPDLFRRVWTETELGAQIEHVNVIGVMGLARLDEGYARVVEYADAESLRSVYRRATTLKKPLPAAIACAIVADACMGVHYAHELGAMESGEPMIHGGIRPETLQVSFKGMGKVTGYGATTIAEVMRKNRGAGEAKDAYTSPEQAYGGRAATTVHSDVYALGCVLYEALTGKAPFAADNDLVEAMIKDELARPQHAGVTAAMATVVLKAMSKKLSERYATALDMRMDILEKCARATELEIRHFMDELFPPETVPRSTRDQMLIAARERPPAPTGSLLTLLPAELDKGSMMVVPSSSDAGADVALARPAEVLVSQQSLIDETTDNIRLLPPSAASTAKGSLAGALVSATSAQVPGAKPSVPGRRAVSPLAASLPRPLSSAAPPSPSAPPVIYRTSPGILIGFGAVGALVLVLIVYAFLQEKPPPKPSVQIVASAPAVVPLPLPPPAPAVPPELPPDAKPSTDTRVKVALPDDDRSRPLALAATGPGKIVVTTSPGNMVISVDGQEIGTGSATWEGKAGPHKVVAKDKALGAVASRVVKLKPGEVVEIELAVRMGVLTFDQLPDGVDVFVDGKRIGTTPMPAIKLYAGPHKIVVKRGGQEVVLDGTVVADRELYITAQFGS